MARTIYILIFSIGCSIAWAQQQPLYTQFMFNKAAINPAYVGNDEFLSLTALVRNQWLGLEGAPAIQQFNLHTPLYDGSIGVGFGLSRYSIGVSDFISMDGQYAYKISLGSSVLSLGGQVSMRNYSVDFSDPRINASDDIALDNAVGLSNQSKYLFNAGFGAYLNSESYFFGFSLPRLFKVNLDFEQDLLNGTEVPHMYLMGGGKIYINEMISFIPQALVRYLSGTPVDFDINLGVAFYERFTAALNYRAGGEFDSFGESIGLVCSAMANRRLQVAFAYDMTLTSLRSHSSGSMEFSINYIFGDKTNSRDYFNPRYF